MKMDRFNIIKRIFFSSLLFMSLAGCGVEWFPPLPEFVTISTTTLPNATVNIAYSQTLSPYGGKAPYTWSITSGTLPAGLTLSVDGVISGTPTTAGTSNFTIQVSDSSTPVTSDTQDFTIQVIAAVTPITITPGQSVTMFSGQSVKVPAGAIITLNAETVVVFGNNNTYNTLAGAIVFVPITATGTADNLVIAQ